MKRLFLMPSVLILAVTLHAQTKKGKTISKSKPAAAATSSAVSLKNNLDSVSCALGISLGQAMKSQGIKTLNYSVLMKALDQTIKDQPTLLNSEQANQVMSRLAEDKMKSAAEPEKEKGREFLVK